MLLSDGPKINLAVLLIYASFIFIYFIMGGKSGSAALHSIKTSSLTDVVDICNGLATELGMDRPRVVADMSNIAYIFSKSSSVIASVANHLVKWAGLGLIMAAVCDGIRPICKQATNQRIANKEKSRIKAFNIRKDIRIAKQRLINEAMTQDQRTTLIKNINKMETQCKSCETQSRSKIPKNFAQELEHELTEMGAHSSDSETAGGYVEEVVVAQFQADLYMAGQVLNKQAVMVVTRDCDIPFLAGDCCIAIKGFTKGKYELVSTSESTLKNAMQHLSKKNNAKFHPAKHPVFDGIKDHRLRALIMLILGCDVYLSGMKGTKVTKLEQLIKSKNAATEDVLYQFLFDTFKTKNGLTSETVDTYIDSLIYEPTNLMPEGMDEENPAKTYLFGPPTRLPKYLEQFSIDDEFKEKNVYEGPHISNCKGVGDHQHQFLSSTGVSTCHKCGDVVCSHCQESIGKDVHCLECFATESIVPQSGCESSKSIADMRRELKDKYNFDGVNDLQSDEVEDAYEMMEFLRDYSRHADESVPFPLYETAEMDGDAPTKWEELLEIDFREGGSFLAEPDLNAADIPKVLHLFASLVRFESGKKTEWMRDAAVYESLPALFIKFAENSRVDSGYRLLMRCVRHAFDSRTPPLENNTAMLVKHKDDIGIHLNASIPASMKKKIYKTGIVATAKEILCCICNCQCGSQALERIVCVHNFPLLFLLTLLLFEDLAEHMLLELAACLSADIWDKSVWSDDDILWMKQSIVTLMEAAGEPVGMHEVKNTSLDDLLQNFVVGTEKRKEWKQRIRTPPKPSELGPIHKMKFVSTAKQASVATKRRHVDCNNTPDEEEDDCAIRLAAALREKSGLPPFDPEKSNTTPFDWLKFGRECHVCFDSIPANVSFLHGPLEKPEDVGDESSSSPMPANTIDSTSDDTPTNVSECTPPQDTFSPDYLRVTLLMDAAKCESVEEKNLVGFKLLNMRSKEQEKNTNRREITSLSKQMENEWKQLQRLAIKRSIRNVDTKVDNIPKKKARTPCTPAKKKKPPRVTPSPPKKPPARRHGQQLPIKQPKMKPSTRCAKKGCKNNNVNSPGLKFHCVTAYPAKIKNENPSFQQVATREGKILLRRETMERICGDRNCKSKKYVCENHEFEVVSRSRTFTFDGKEYTRSFRLTVPTGIVEEEPETTSKGIGRDRAMRRVLEEVLKKDVAPGLHVEEEGLDEALEQLQSEEIRTNEQRIRNLEEQNMYKDAKLELAQANIVQSTKAVQQLAEENCSDKHVPINSTLQQMSGLDAQKGNANSVKMPNKHFFHADPVRKKVKRHYAADEPPSVHLGMSDKEVKRRTGFPCEKALLSYIFVVCNGDIDTIKKRQTSLTWYEEWFLHREYSWGKSLTRIEDVTATFGIYDRDVRRVIADKYDIEFRALMSWPMYASYEEDKALRKKKWDGKYKNVRPVMWDMTNVSAYGFTDADFQRLTYSKYYGENCFKGGVFTQLCGFQGAADLWTGGVSDSNYNRGEGYLERQTHFQNKDLVEINGTKTVVPFLNIYDKGYRAKMAAWKNGKQQVLQPDWAESDRRFGRLETLNSASVASDRGGNERSVNVSKRAGYISRGFYPNMCTIRFNQAWRTWAFQSNFMFQPVL